MAFGDILNDPAVDHLNVNFGTSWPITLASTPAAGSLLLVCVTGGSGAGGLVTPSGFSVAQNVVDASLGRQNSVYAKISDGTETAVAIGQSESANILATVYVVEGPFDSATPDESATSDNSDSSLVTFGSITTSEANAFVLGFEAHNNNGAYSSVDSGFVADVDDNVLTGGNGFGAVSISKVLSSAGTESPAITLSSAQQSASILIAFYRQGVADTTAPTFSAGPTAGSATEAGHTISTTLDEAGTIYAVRLADGASAPSSAQVKAGQDSTGSAAPEAKSVSASAGVSADMVFSTGSGTTAYDYYVVAEDDEGAPNLQASPTLVEATTTAPVFSVDSVSGGDQPGESWVFALSNDSGADMTANIGGTALTVTAQTSGSITVTIPDLLTFDGGIHRFSENLTVQIVDGANSDTIDTPITPATGFAQVQMPNPIAGVWASSTFEAAISPGVLEVGDYIHCTAPTDSDPANGIFPEDSSIVYRIMDMSDGTPAWGTSGTITIPAADDEAPVITLTGDATINLSEGDSYTEQGATWTDNIDGSGAATVGGDTVDTATPGTYTVTYNYTDAAGNAATQVTRTINVANVNDSPTGSVTIDNTTPATGDTLTASNTLADEDGLGAITYQWYRGASPISGATSSTYSVVSADYGEALSVRASYTDQQGTSETVPSAATSTVTDGEAPVITLNGSATVTHAQGTAYNDAGATALDGVDGNLTGDIVTTGASFDTGTVGTYTIRYNVSDAAGNAATEVTRTVNVTDQTIPVITLTGGDVTLTEGGTYSEPGYTATDNNDGDISNSVVVAGDTVDPNTVGVYTVTYNVDDDAGNSAAQKTRTVTVRAASSTEIIASTPFSRTIFVSPNGETGVPVFIKDTSDVIDFLVDFSAALQGDSISVVEVATSNITLDATYRTGNKVQLWLSGGIAKVMAELKITAQSDAGRTIERSFKVKVGEY